MTEGGSSIPEVQALLGVLASGRKAGEAGTAFGMGAGFLLVDDMTPGWEGHDPARAFLFGHPQLRVVEVLTTPTTSALIAVKHVH
ncbi:MAG: hypothetical protein GEU71_14460 [Actinobacteria bacterium]|nr:hypothetical protein [Actinomycetota bacterium]